MVHNQIEKDETATKNHQESHTPTPGRILSRSRMKMNMTIEQVASQLHLSKTWLEHIEQDDYSDAPALIYVRGYLRSYARLVEVPVGEVMEAFDKLNLVEEPEALVPPSFKRRYWQSKRNPFKVLMWWVIGFLLVITLAVVIIRWSISDRVPVVKQQFPVQPQTQPQPQSNQLLQKQNTLNTNNTINTKSYVNNK